MYLLVDCSNCKTPLQFQSGIEVIRCGLCQALTAIGDPRAAGIVPSPYNHAPKGPLPSVFCRKKAVICGISYKSTKNELQGCINDAKCMRFLLMNRFHFPAESILMLTEEETDPYRIPTKKNIKMALFWLVQGVQPGDSLVFHFSGHGSNKRNYSGDEVDGYDETICPLDFETEGQIIDDEINETIVRPLPQGAKLHAIIDACHSGTVLDLPFLCRMDKNGHYVWEDHRPISGAWKGTSGGEVYSFSGCDDDQISGDTTMLSKVASTGVMTFCFIQAIESGKATTYGSMLASMRSTISTVGKASAGDVLLSSIISMLVSGSGAPVTTGGLNQTPQLTSCVPFDVYATPFSI